jgi:hypothetical protein
MKKHLAGFLIIACLGTFSWAQGNKADLFDTTKSAQELEIMKGILGTTLSFVAQNLQKQEASKASAKTVATPFGPVYGTAVSWRTANINAFYLFGQGAVFVMPASSFRLSGYRISSRYDAANLEFFYEAQEKASEVAALEREVRAQAREAARQSAAATSGVAGATPVPPAAAKPAASPAPPVPPVQLKEEELRKKVAEAQEKVKKTREEIEANNAKFLAALEQIKVHLIEAIANHADSLTTVKPNEYITLVIMTDDLESSAFRSESGPRSNQQIISVQKSLITDYKAGRLTLDGFKQKILQYSE